MAVPYTDTWRRKVRAGAAASARALVPAIIEELGEVPGSVIDVGCGEAWFLAEFERHGAADTVGVEGEWAKNAAGAQARFVHVDLSRPEDYPGTGRQFDLAVSLEVAEHLPERAAAPFVEFLTSLAPVVVFSAAVPGQGGEGHVNERWPTYWCHLFAEHRFVPSLALRDRVWDDEQIEWWYRQNVAVYRRFDEHDPPRFPSASDLNRVHPGMVHHHGRVQDAWREWI